MAPQRGYSVPRDRRDLVARELVRRSQVDGAEVERGHFAGGRYHGELMMALLIGHKAYAQSV